MRKKEQDEELLPPTASVDLFGRLDPLIIAFEALRKLDRQSEEVMRSAKALRLALDDAGNDLRKEIEEKSEVGTLVERALLILTGQSSDRAVKDAPDSPPKGAQVFLYFVLSRRQRDNVMGDLEEAYVDVIIPKLGIRWARVWFWWQAIRALGFQFLKLGTLVEFIRKFAGD